MRLRKLFGLIEIFNHSKFLIFLFKIYSLTMIFNSLYEINISLVGTIYQIMYLMYQINLILISIKLFN